MLNREDWNMIREMRAKGCCQREIADKVGESARSGEHLSAAGQRRVELSNVLTP